MPKVLACIGCRMRRRRCHRQIPLCSECQDIGIPQHLCIYRDSLRVPKGQSAKTELQKLRKAYYALLENYERKMSLMNDVYELKDLTAIEESGIHNPIEREFRSFRLNLKRAFEIPKDKLEDPITKLLHSRIEYTILTNNLGIGFLSELFDDLCQLFESVLPQYDQLISTIFRFVKNKKKVDLILAKPNHGRFLKAVQELYTENVDGTTKINITLPQHAVRLVVLSQSLAIMAHSLSDLTTKKKFQALAQSALYISFLFSGKIDPQFVEAVITVKLYNSMNFHDKLVDWPLTRDCIIGIKKLLNPKGMDQFLLNKSKDFGESFKSCFLTLIIFDIVESQITGKKSTECQNELLYYEKYSSKEVSVIAKALHILKTFQDMRIRDKSEMIRFAEEESIPKLRMLLASFEPIGTVIDQIDAILPDFYHLKDIVRLLQTLLLKKFIFFFLYSVHSICFDALKAYKDSHILKSRYRIQLLRYNILVFKVVEMEALLFRKLPAELSQIIKALLCCQIFENRIFISMLDTLALRIYEKIRNVRTEDQDFERLDQKYFQPENYNTHIKLPQNYFQYTIDELEDPRVDTKDELLHKFQKLNDPRFLLFTACGLLENISPEGESNLNCYYDIFRMLAKIGAQDDGDFEMLGKSSITDTEYDTPFGYNFQEFFRRNISTSEDTLLEFDNDSNHLIDVSHTTAPDPQITTDIYLGPQSDQKS